MYRLSERAQRDLERIVSTIAENEGYGGLLAAMRVADALDTAMHAIAEHRIPGHPNHRYRVKRTLLFATANPMRYVIAFDPQSREIVAIAHGGQDPELMFVDA